MGSKTRQCGFLSLFLSSWQLPILVVVAIRLLFDIVVAHRVGIIINFRCIGSLWRVGYFGRVGCHGRVVSFGIGAVVRDLRLGVLGILCFSIVFDVSVETVAVVMVGNDLNASVGESHLVPAFGDFTIPTLVGVKIGVVIIIVNGVFVGIAGRVILEDKISNLQRKSYATLFRSLTS